MTNTPAPSDLDAGAEAAAAALDDLRARLRDNPEIVTGDHALMAAVRDALAGESVVDLSQRARQKLERELGRVRATNTALIELAKANLAVQAQVHGAVLAVMPEADAPDPDSIVLVGESMAPALGAASPAP